MTQPGKGCVFCENVINIPVRGLSLCNTMWYTQSNAKIGEGRLPPVSRIDCSHMGGFLHEKDWL